MNSISLKKTTSVFLSILIMLSVFIAVPNDSNDVQAASAAPSGVKLVEYSMTAAKITWTKAAGASGYYIYQSTDNKTFSKMKTLSAEYSSYSNYKLSSGKTYYFAVSSYQTSGGKTTESAKSGSVKVTTATSTSHAAPTSFKVSSYTNAAIGLSWKAASGASGYYLYRSTDGTTYTRYKTLSAAAVSYKDTGLTSGKKYYYQIATLKKLNGAVGIGPKSSAVSATTTNEPLTLKGTALSSSSVKLTWSQMSSSAKYQIFRYNTEKKKYEVIKTLSAPSTTWTDSNLKDSTSYVYSVRGYVTDNKGAAKFTPYSFTMVKTPANAATPPSAPKGLKVISQSSNTAKLSWSKVAGVTGYVVYRSNDNKSFTRIKTITSADTVTCSNSGLTSGTTYYYAVASYKKSNGTSVIGNRSSSVKVQTTTASIIAAPSGVSTSQMAANSIMLTWNSVPNVSGYYIYRSVGGGSYSLVQTLSKETTSFIDSKLTVGSTYSYRVYSYKIVSGVASISQPSKAVSQNVSSSSISVTGVKAELYSNGNVKLSWDAINGASGYQVYMQSPGVSDYELAFTTNANETSKIITSLGANKTYTFKIRAVFTVNGTSCYSGYGTLKFKTSQNTHVDSAADSIYNLINGERSKKGLKLLARNADIDKLAELRAEELKTKFSHTRPNGSDWYSVFYQAGLKYLFCGENIAYGHSNAEMVIDTWMSKEIEKENILDDKYSCMGVGVYYYNNAPYYVVIFYRPLQ